MLAIEISSSEYLNGETSDHLVRFTPRQTRQVSDQGAQYALVGLSVQATVSNKIQDSDDSPDNDYTPRSGAKMGQISDEPFEAWWRGDFQAARMLF